MVFYDLLANLENEIFFSMLKQPREIVCVSGMIACVVNYYDAIRLQEFKDVFEILLVTLGVDVVVIIEIF